MLRLVPPPGAQGQDPPKRRKHTRAAALILSPDELHRVRAAIQKAARAYGGLDVLAVVTGIRYGTLDAAKRRNPQGIIAIRVAQAMGVSVESVLSDTITEAGRCNACGHRAATGRASGLPHEGRDRRYSANGPYQACRVESCAVGFQHGCSGRHSESPGAAV